MAVGAIGADPQPGVATRSQFSDTELAALIATTYDVQQIAPGLLAWIEQVCDWELNRRWLSGRRL